MAECKYNGIVLPALPETAYPYQFITDETTTRFFACDKHGYVETYDSAYGYTLGGDLISGNDNKTIYYTEWVLTDGEWVLKEENTYGIVITVSGFVWSNHDILNEDGALHIAASYPVPAFDLKSFLTGLALGLAGKPLPLAPAQEPVQTTNKELI